jgi:hypothetical protein
MQIAAGVTLLIETDERAIAEHLLDQLMIFFL